MRFGVVGGRKEGRCGQAGAREGVCRESQVDLKLPGTRGGVGSEDKSHGQAKEHLGRRSSSRFQDRLLWE